MDDNYLLKAMPGTIWVEKFKKSYKEYLTSKKIPLYFHELDDNIKLYGEKLITICARSELGKTSLAANMIKHQLMSGFSVLMFCCEERGEDFICRLINHFWPRYLTQEEIDRLFILDESFITIKGIIEELKIVDKFDKIDIIYIDQLNKIQDSNSKSKHERVERISEQLQYLVKKTCRPVVVLHQANRASEHEKGFMTQSSVRYADAVFNESQILFFVESPEFQEWNKTKNPPNQIVFDYYINIGKNRTHGGWKGAVPCIFDRSTGIFLNDQKEFERYKIRRNSWEHNKEKNRILTINTGIKNIKKDNDIIVEDNETPPF
jgi:replicative DNA helicase